MLCVHINFMIRFSKECICSFSLQHMGSREGVAAKIDADTVLKIEEMNRSISTNKAALINEILKLVYDIKPQLHKNFQYLAKK